MDLLSMVMNAVVEDIGGESIGKVEGIEIRGTRMVIIVDEILSDDGDPDDGDPDGGEELDDLEDEKEPLKFPRAVVGSGGGGSGG